jgi:hypothetical protein
MEVGRWELGAGRTEKEKVRIRKRGVSKPEIF